MEPASAVGSAVGLERHTERLNATDDGRLVIQYPFSDAEESTDELVPGDKPGAIAPRKNDDDANMSPTLRQCDDAEDSEGVDETQLDDAEKAMKNEQVTMSGYLLKKGEKRRTWKSRWFVLRPTRLAYYQNDKEYELLKIIDMRDIHAIAEVELKKRRNVFGLVTRERTYYIQAGSGREAEDWLRALRAAHNHLRSESQSHRSSESGPSTSPTRSSRRPSNPPPAANPIIHDRNASSLPQQPPAQPNAHHPLASSERETASQISNAESAGTADSFLTNTSTPSSVFTDYAYSTDSTPSTAIPYMPPPILRPAGMSGKPAPISAQRETSPRREAMGIRVTTFADNAKGDEPSSPTGAARLTSSAASTPSHARGETSSSEEEGDDGDAAGAAGAPIDDSVVIMQGYLEKRVAHNYKKIATAGVKGWKKRWFVLRGGSLFGYKNDGEYVVKRLIPLSSVLDILEIDPQGKHHSFCFKIVLPKRQLVLCADTEKEMSLWIAGLRNIHGAVRRDSSAGASP
ncbi:hypothetical protein HDU86_004892 [Geranomyces michiganensis]|nr:hypothetical protein HDU86_004892 [Geranomyces michiganensis]